MMQPIWSSFKGAWMRYWFHPELPFNLAACRILFFGAMFLWYLPNDYALWGTLSDVFWMPMWVFDAFQIPVFSATTLDLLQVVWKLALLLSCIGLFTSVSTTLSFGLGFYLIGLPHNMGKVDHVDALVVFIFGLMMIARCGDVLSVDRWIRRLRGTTPPVRASGEYRWPVRAVWLLYALIFFAAGYAKLTTSGLEWVFSANMAQMLLEAQYDHTPLVDWGVFIAQYPWLYQPMAAMALVLEIGYPLALFSRRARWIFPLGMVLTQVGIWMLMGPSFVEFMICNLFWIPWGIVAIRLGMPLPSWAQPSPSTRLSRSRPSPVQTGPRPV